MSMGISSSRRKKREAELVGVLECWSVGVRSITPLLHYSITPVHPLVHCVNYDCRSRNLTSHPGPPRRHRPGDAELVVSHRLLDDHSRVGGCELRDSHTPWRSCRPARRATPSHGRIPCLRCWFDEKLQRRWSACTS